MNFTRLGSTGLRVSVAGIGCGGFSALGMSNGKTEEEAADVVRTALDLGVNYIDTAAVYGTEGAVGRAIAGRRNEVVIATKGPVADRAGRLLSGAEIADGIDSSLRALRTEFIDVYQPHGPRPGMLEHLLHVALPVLVRAKEAGKIAHIGLSESGDDPQHEIVAGAANASAAFEVMLIAFHMMHQTAGQGLFERLRRDGVGVVVMYAVRNMFARKARLAEVFAELAADGRLPAAMARQPDPLGFLVHAAGAASLTEAAYRFARYERGVDVVLFGTGDPDHVRANVAAILKPPLPDEDIAKIRELFGHLAGVGLDRKPGRGGNASPRNIE